MLADFKHKNGSAPHLVGEPPVLLMDGSPQKELGSVPDKVGA